MDARKRFEAWISSKPYEHMCDMVSECSAWPGQYKRYETQLAWEAWQQAISLDREATMGCCKHGNTDGECLRCEEEFAEAVEAENSRSAKIVSALEAENSELRASLELLEEAIEAILNLAPGVRNERGGCFGNRQAENEAA